MRTRFLSKLTNGEVEEYLKYNDLIFVPVGTTETHGALPLDVETVAAEAFAKKLAEKTEGLVLHNLPYFYAGGTPVGRGTVQMSIRDGIDYLDKIAQSLLNQGFKRQVYVTFHGPAYLTVSPMIRDFFDRTKVPLLYIDIVEFLKSTNLDFMENANPMMIGGYSVLNRLNDVPLNIPESNSVTYDAEEAMNTMKNHPSEKLTHLGPQSGVVGYYFEKPLAHTYTPLLKTEEEREEIAERGVDFIDKVVEALDIEEVVKSLKDVDEFTQNHSLPNYEKWLPRTHN